jgi:hypothetical protein
MYKISPIQGAQFPRFWGELFRGDQLNHPEAYSVITQITLASAFGVIVTLFS